MKDKFEILIGKQLRNATAPVPADAWKKIQDKLSNPPPIQGFNSAWMAAVATVALLLGVVSWYSQGQQDAARHFWVAQPDVPQNTNKSAAEQLKVFEKSTAPVAGSLNPAADDTISTAHEPVEAASAGITKTTSPAMVEVQANWSAEELFPVATTVKPTVPVFTRHEEIPENLRNSQEVHRIIEELTANAAASGNSIEPARISATGRSGYAPFEVTLTAENEASSYRWELSNGKTAQKKSLNLVLDIPGVYTVYLSTTDDAGNISTDMVELEVLEGPKLFVPNSFTPNKDGINDVYKAEGILIEEFEMQIRSVEGEVLFKSNDMENGWSPDLYILKSKTREPHLFFVTVIAKDIKGKSHNVSKKINVIY